MKPLIYLLTLAVAAAQTNTTTTTNSAIDRSWFTNPLTSNMAFATSGTQIGLYSHGTKQIPLVVVTNRPWVQIDGVVILQLTEAEWSLVTNSYSKYLVTNTLTIYGEKKL